MRNQRHQSVTMTLYQIKCVRAILALLNRTSTYIAEEEPYSGKEVARGIALVFDEVDELLQKVGSAVGNMTVISQNEDIQNKDKLL